MGVAKKIGKKAFEIAKEFFYPSDLMGDNDSFTKEQLMALSDRKTISKSLFYRSYIETDGDKAGFYIQADGRVGIVFRLYPPPYLLGDTEKDIINLLNSIALDDTVINISTYASRDLHRLTDSYKHIHNKTPNIKNQDILKQMNKEYIEKIERWTKESMSGKEADLRVRNFIHTLSILFPYDTDDFIINQQFNQIMGMFKKFSIRALKPDELIPIVREILNPALGKYPIADDPITTINKQMTKNTFIELNEKDKLLHLPENWKARVLTTDKYPREMDIFTFQNLFFSAMGNDFQINLPCPFLLSLTVKFKDVKKQKKIVLAKARWNLGQLSGMPPIIYKKRPHIKERKDENEEVIQYIENLGEIPLEAFLSLTLFEENKNKLDQYTALIKKSFENTKGQWILKEEQFPQIAYQTLLMSLPLQYSEIIHTNIDKFDKNFKSNNAQIAPLIGDFGGNGDPYFVYFGRTGQVISLDIFNSDNYNICVIGPMGSGKSVWANDFLAKGLGNGWSIRMIDFGRSYKKFCENIGGQFVEFTPDSNICMNFFTDITIRKEIDESGNEIEIIREEDVELFVPIVGYMAGLNLQDIYKDIYSSSEDKLNMTILSVFIAKAINKAFSIKGKDAGMREVREALMDYRTEAIKNEEISVAEQLGKMIISLEPYAIPSGAYYSIFNGASNVSFESSYFVLELDDISNSPVMPVVAMLFLQKVAREAFIKYNEDKSTRRVVGVDEAWKVLNNPLFAKFLEDFARRIRKNGGITLILTQNVNELFQNPQAEVIYSTADWKIFLPHGKSAIEQATKTDKISMTEFEKKLFQSIQSRYPHYGEFFIKHKNRAFVALLKLTRLGYWLFTTNPQDKAKIDATMKRFKLSTQDALIYLALKDEGKNDEEIFSYLSKRNKKDLDMDWDQFFKDVLAKKSIKVRKEPIVSYANEIVFYENLPSLYKGKIEYSPKDYMHKARELGYFFKLKKEFFKKVIYENSQYNNSINISLSGIRNKSFVRFLENTIAKADKKFYLEIRLDYNEVEVTESIEFARKIKDQFANAGIIFDNVSFKTISLASLIDFRPEYIKININEFRKRENDKGFISLIDVLEENFNIKTIATFIENKEEFAFAKKLGIRYYQGYYINEKFISIEEVA